MFEEEIVKKPPYSQEAEEAVLGALLVDSDAMAFVADTLSHNDFHFPKNVCIYEICETLFNRSEPINQVTIYNELDRSGRLKELDSAGYLSHLIAHCATSVHIEYYAKIVNQNAARRALLHCSKEIEDLADAEDVDRAYGDALGLLLRLKNANLKEVVETPKARADYAVERYSKLNENENTTVLSFGLHCLDKYGGMQGGDSIALSGPTGEGKTTFARQIAGHVAAEYGEVLFVSLEMSKAQTTDRDIARLTQEYVLKIMRGKYKEETYDKICGAIGAMSQERINYYHPAIGTLPKIYAAARRLQSQQGLKLIVIDYVQLLRDSEGGKNLEERMANISRGIKSIARELDIPIMALSRMSRDKDAKDINRLYGSGALEYDADWVLFLKREKTKNTLTIAKQRQGGMKSEQELDYIWQTQTFKEVSR